MIKLKHSDENTGLSMDNVLQNNFLVILPGLVLCIAILFSVIQSAITYFPSYAYHFTDFLSYVFKGMAWSAFILATVYLFMSVFDTGKRTELALLFFSVAYMLYVSVSLVFTAVQLNEEKERERLLLLKVIEMRRDLEGGRGVEKEYFDPGIYGKKAAAAQLANDYYLQLQADLENFRNNIVQYDLQSTLAPETMEKTHEIVEARSTLQDFRQRMDEYEDTMKQHAGAYTDKANRLELPEPFKIQFVRNLNDSAARVAAQITEYYALERNVLEKMDSLLAWMEGNNGKYIMSNGRLKFKEMKDADIYNALSKQLQAELKEKDGWLENARQKSAEQLAQFEREIEKKFFIYNDVPR